MFFDQPWRSYSYSYYLLLFKSEFSSLTLNDYFIRDIEIYILLNLVLMVNLKKCPEVEMIELQTSRMVLVILVYIILGESGILKVSQTVWY